MQSPRATAPSPSAATPSSVTLESAWPRCTQLATAFLLGMAVVLVVLKASGSLSWGARPTDWDSHAFAIERLDPSRIPIDSRTIPAAIGIQPIRPMNAPPLGKKEMALEGPIDINRATAADLQRLPGIGPKLSQRIVDERQKGPFKSVAELRRVPGIGPKILEKLRPHVTVGGDSIRLANRE